MSVMMSQVFLLGYTVLLGWAAQVRCTMTVADPLRTCTSLCTCTSRWLASGFLHVFTPFVHGLFQCVVDFFAGRRPRQQLELVAFVDKQQRALRGLAGAIMCADRTVCVEFDAGCVCPVADPFGCVRGSQL